MPFDGSGTFTRVHRWQDDRDNGIRILADRHDAEDDNFATAFNQTFLRTGIVPMTGNLSMNGNSIVGIKGGTAASPSLRWELDPMTGFYQPAPQQLAIAINGVQRMLWTATGGNFDGNVTTTGNVTVGGTLGVTGNFTGSNVILSGNLSAVNGSFTGQVAASTGVFSSSISATSLVTTSDEGLRMRGTAPYFSWYNAAGTTRLGYMQHNGTNIILANEAAGNIQFNNYLGVGVAPATQFHAKAAAWPTLRLEKSSVGFWDVSVGQGGAGGNSFSINVNGGPALFEVNTDGTTTVASSLWCRGAQFNAQPPGGGAYEIVNRGATGGIKLYPTGSVLGIDIAPNGTVTLPGSMIISGGNLYLGASVAVSRSGGGLYVYSGTSDFRVLRNDGGATLLQLDNASGLLSLAGVLSLPADIYQIRIGGNAFLRSSVSGTQHNWINGANGTIWRNSADNATLMVLGDNGHLAIKSSVWHLDTDGGQRMFWASGDATYMKCGNSSGVGFYFRRSDDTVVMQIGNDGNVTATNFTATSDERTKYNIRTVDSALEKVLAMRGVLFNRKSDDSEDAGVVAQELLKVAPELVHTKHGTMSVNYGGLSAYLIQAINELARKL